MNEETKQPKERPEGELSEDQLTNVAGGFFRPEIDDEVQVAAKPTPIKGR